MSHAFRVSDKQYRAIEAAAHVRGQEPEEYFHAWVAAVRRHLENEQEDPDQAWFWTPEWQAKEREADAAIAAHEGKFYDSPEVFLANMDEE